MPKPRTKRQAIRDERKKKRRETHEANYEVNDEERSAKRQRVHDGEEDTEQPTYDGEGEQQEHFHGSVPEKEFFGMLADEEQEYFRHADELLELNQFPTPEERDVFLQNV